MICSDKTWPIQEAMRDAVTLEESKRNTLEMVYKHFDSIKVCA